MRSGVVEFFEVKNGLVGFLAKLRVLWNRVIWQCYS